MNEKSPKVMLFLYVYSIFLSTATVGLVGSRLDEDTSGEDRFES